MATREIDRKVMKFWSNKIPLAANRLIPHQKAFHSINTADGNGRILQIFLSLVGCARQRGSERSGRLSSAVFGPGWVERTLNIRPLPWAVLAAIDKPTNFQSSPTGKPRAFRTECGRAAGALD